MLKLSHATLWLSAVAALPLAAHAQNQPAPGQAPAPAPSQSAGNNSTETTTTSTTRPAAPPSPDLNTDTNSQPDITGTSGHPDTDVRIKGKGSLASAMANFSVRTGLEVRPSSTGQVVVQSVRPETASARAGIEAGDILTNVDGTEVTTIDSLQKVLTKHPSQSAFFASFRRGEKDFRAPLGRQLSLMGMTLFPDPADRPVVKAVDPASPAERAGFKVGDVITRVDRQDASTMSKLIDFAVPFMRNLAQGQGIPFLVVRDGKPIHFSVTRPADAELPILTPDQERHLRRVAEGDDNRPRHDQRAKGYKTTTTRKQRREQQIGSIDNSQMQQPNQNGLGGVAGAGGFGGGIVGLDGGGIGTGLDSGLGGTGTGTNGSTNVNAAVAVIQGTSNIGQAQTQGTSTNGAGMNGNNKGSGMGAVGFVQIQSNIGLNGQNGSSNINPSAPGANPETGNTTSDTGVNPVTGNAATNNLNPAASALNRPARGAGVQQGTAQTGATGLQGQNGLQQQVQPTGNGTFGDSFPDFSNQTGTGNPTTNGTNANNSNNNSQQPQQSFVSAQVSRVPPGTYTLTVGQFGACGDSAGVAPGPSVFTLGTVTVGAGGQGTLPQRTINIAPSAFVGRTVQLVAQNSSSSQNSSGVVGCGRFRASGQNNNQNNQGNGAFIGNNGQVGVGNNGVGLFTGGNGATGTGTMGNGTATGTGAVTGHGGTATGTGTATPTGATGTGTANPTAPGSITPPGGLPKPQFP